ncbi:MAG: MarR family transcriptional regulator [Clostridia bacterium]|nr:MarR family transcriptional regulator [Clostridia bacterium]
MPKRYDNLDINNKLIWNLRDIGHTLRALFEGKGSQKRILIVLYETGSITQSDLTQHLGIQPGSASEVLAKLESAGLITRTMSEADRRTTDILLTETGMAAAEEAKREREERHEQIFSCFNAEEKQELLSMLERLNASWDESWRDEERDSRRSRRK